MIRFYRFLIGTIWGAVVGILAAHFVGKAFHYDAIISGITIGLPVLFGLLGGLHRNQWNGFWEMILYPFSGLALAASIFYALLCIALISSNMWHFLWMIPVLFMLAFTVKKVIAFTFKKAVL